MQRGLVAMVVVTGSLIGFRGRCVVAMVDSMTGLVVGLLTSPVGCVIAVARLCRDQ